MALVFPIIPIAYHENEISILLHQQNNQFEIIMIKDPTDVTHFITPYFKTHFDCDLEPSQIKLLPPHINKQNIQIPVIVQIKTKQLPTLTQTNQYQTHYSFENINLLVNLSDNDRQIIGFGQQTLIDNYHLHQLTAIHQLLAPEFTTKYLTAFLRKLTHEPIKYNNIRRTFQDQLKFIKTDRSKKGHPKSIFKYQKKP